MVAPHVHILYSWSSYIQDALEQLLVTLNYQQEVLSAKKIELESSIPFGSNHEGKSM